MGLKYIDVTVGARGSRLSQIQVWEVEKELQARHSHVRFFPIWVQTKGDKDQKSSLRTMEKSDFFTHEIDAMQKKSVFRIAIHSAKDLPDPIPQGLKLVALTKGRSNRDALVLREGEALFEGARIGTSTERRIKAVHALKAGLTCVDIRGTIDARLAALDSGEVDGLVVALCALERLEQIHRNHVVLPGEAAPLQGKLAVLAFSGDLEMQQLFESIDYEAHSLSRD